MTQRKPRDVISRVVRHQHAEGSLNSALILSSSGIAQPGSADRRQLRSRQTVRIQTRSSPESHRHREVSAPYAPIRPFRRPLHLRVPPRRKPADEPLDRCLLCGGLPNSYLLAAEGIEPAGGANASTQWKSQREGVQLRLHIFENQLTACASCVFGISTTGSRTDQEGHRRKLLRLGMTRDFRPCSVVVLL